MYNIGSDPYREWVKLFEKDDRWVEVSIGWIGDYAARGIGVHYENSAVIFSLLFWSAILCWGKIPNR